MPNVSGTVYRSESKERIVNATLKAVKGSKVIYATTNDDGDFSIDLPETGKWTIIALYNDSFPSTPNEIDMTEDYEGVSIYLARIAGKVDETAGKIIFWVLLALLAGLIYLYLTLHEIIPVEENSGAGFAIWSSNPLKYLEIILWGLGGILVNKIITVAWYMRSHRFYREGILMHIGHICTTPLLVLVTVLILSLVTLDISMTGDNSIAINLNTPDIMIAFAFILGTSPWPLWRFIENAGKRFTSQFD